MSPSSRRCLAALGAVAALAVPAAASAADRIPGFTAERSQAQRDYETRFQDAVSNEAAGRTNRALSKRPRLIGTAGNRRSLAWELAKLRKWGFDPDVPTYDVYASVARQIQVSMTKPYFRRARVKEDPFPWHKNFDEVVPGYNAYSAAGDVTGQLVYVNYGLPDDYEALEKAGVDVSGKIAIARYGQSFRGVKSKVAEEHGAKGLIIYSDPEDDGYLQGAVYPEGPWRPAESIQRGSVEYIFQYPGDPLTPGKPSIPGTKRLDPSDAKNLTKIPTTPLSYGEAQTLLQHMGGPAAPESFQGGLPFQYHLGPGPTEARLNLDIDYEQLPVRDVVVEIPGRERPNEKVIVGGHRDAWTYGAADNNSGFTSVLEVARGLGKLLQRGWRPERTIVLAGWDGEEYGLLGATEWAEQLRAELMRNAVAYINMDGTGGRSFGPSGVPALDDLLVDVSKTVPGPGAPGSVYDGWTADGPPEVGRLGSGSDYTAFLQHLGVPSMDVGFSSPGGEYHSAFDDTFQMEHFLDPGYLGQAAAARVSGVLALRLANADIPQLTYSDYAAQVEAYVAEVAKQQGDTPIVDLEPLADAASAWRAAAQQLEAKADELLQEGDPASGKLAAINRALRRQERALLQDQGLEGRSWFRHMVYAPGRYTGYAVQVLPGLVEAIEDGDAARAKEYRDLIVKSVQAATEEADI